MKGTRVQDVMIRDVVTAPLDLPVKQLISGYFLRYGHRGFPVTADGKVLGMISLANVKDLSEQKQAEKKVRQVMAPVNGAMTISPETPLTDALEENVTSEHGSALGHARRSDDRHDHSNRIAKISGDQTRGPLNSTGRLFENRMFVTLGKGDEPCPKGGKRYVSNF